MAPRPLIIDCDPGVDDGVALLLAFASPEDFELLAVTTVGGNVGAELTARNACVIRQIAGREDVPVYAGAATPMVRPPVAASHFHGESGLGSLPLFEPAKGPAEGHAAQTLVEAVMSRPAGAVSLAVMGPMTNLALAMLLEPRLAARLGPIVAMGGARTEGGNITASAEFNIFADPHAAQVVFGRARDIVVLGLDATHQVRATPERLAAVEAIDTPSSQAAAELLRFRREVERRLGVGESAPMHDPCTVAWLLAPHLFETRPCRLEVEIASPLTLGHTAVEFRLDDPGAATCRWVVKADGAGVFALLTERLARR